MLDELPNFCQILYLQPYIGTNQATRNKILLIWQLSMDFHVNKLFDMFNSYTEDGLVPTTCAYRSKQLKIQDEHLDKYFKYISNESNWKNFIADFSKKYYYFNKVIVERFEKKMESNIYVH